MPWRDRDHLQTPGNWTLLGLLFVGYFLPPLPSVHSYFMSESKAVFRRGCGDYWTLQDRNEMPPLHQVSVCTEVCILSPGQWTAFTYRTPHTPHYDLALGGDVWGLEVWLLGVQHRFSIVLQLHRWYHICLRRNSLSNILRLEVDDWAAERTVVGQAIPPAGELLLGCQVQEHKAAMEEAVRVELYLFRVWRDVQQHGACEDGDVVGWDSSQWTVAGKSKARDDSLLCALPVVGRLLPTPLPKTKAAPDSSSESNVMAASSVLPELLGQSQYTAAQSTFTNIDPYNIQEACYRMAVAVEMNGDHMSVSNISSWLAGVFDRVPCDPSAAETNITNSTHSVPVQSGICSPSYNWTGVSSDSTSGTLEATSDRKEGRCTNQGKASFTLLQDVEVTCDSKEAIRKISCTVLLQLSQPIDTCVLNQLLQKASASGSVEAHILGEVERVAKGLCLTEDLLPPDGRFMRCISSTPFSGVCLDNGLVNVTCKLVESEDLFAEIQGSGKEICREDHQICNCSSFCSGKAAYYTLVLNVTSPTFTMTDLKTTVSQLGIDPDCKSMPQDHCVLFTTVAQVYQGVHLECHGTEIRLHSCMVIVKLARPLDVCALSSVVTALLQHNTDISYDGIITRAAICGWLSEPSYDLLDSNFTWVSTDLSLSQICEENDPIILTCQEGETLSVLLNETCKDLSTPVTNGKILKFSTVNKRAQPFSSTEYITTSLPSNATQYNTTTLPSNVTQSNATSLPSNATQSNAAALSSNATRSNATSLPSNATQYNTTTLPSNAIQYNATTLPSNAIQYNATSLPSNSTQSNITALSSNSTQSNITSLPSNTTQSNTTTLPSNMTQSNTTTLPSNATQYNTTALPSNSTQYNTTSLPSNMTQSNTTSLPSNTTQYNTTALPSNTTQYNTTTLPSNTTQYNTTSLPSKPRLGNGTAFTLKRTQGNVIAFPSMNATDFYTTNALSNAKTNQTTMNTTAGTVASNTTSVITSTTTATNSRRLPVRPAEMPTNIASEHSTASSTPVMSLEEHVICLLNKTRELPAVNSTLMGQWVSQLEGLLSGPNISLTLGSTAISIVSNLLHANTAVLAPFSTRIIRIVDTVGLKLVLEDKMEMVSAELLALAVTRVNGFSFQETSFSISDPSSLQISVRNGPRSRGSALFLGSITLPPSLTDGLTSQEQMLASRVQFSFYQNSTVFQDRGLGNRKLNSGVLGTSVANLSISGLKEDVVITLKNREPVMGNFVTTCVFWDFGYNDGTGGWNPTGCHVQDTTYNVTVCSCNHLTSFTVLLDFSRGGITNVLQATVLAYITYIGCGISAVFLSVTLLTYLGFEKLRKDIPSKILIQLCLALLLLNLVFLLDPWLALYPSATGLCICTAFFLHYFLLVSFTWMGLEAFHMYLALVKVFNTYVSRYMLKFSLVGWGVPLVVVIIVIAINKDNYGQISYGKYRDGSTDDFCWLKNDIAFYVAVVAYFCLVFLLNMAIFVVVLVQLCRIKRQNPHDSQHRNVLQDLRSVASLTFLLGLTWGFAFFAWGPVNLAFMYLFSIFNSLQGFFIFVFHCAVKKSVRRQWRAYLCCGSLRLLENSEWSRTNRHSVITAPSIHSSNMFSASFLASDTGGIRHLEGNESPFDDSTIMFPDDQHENVSRQRMRTSE